MLQLCCGRFGFLEIVSGQHHLGAEGAGLADFHVRRRHRHDNGRRHAEGLGVPGETLRMIAGGGGDDAAGAFFFREQHQLVERAALLERAGVLQVLELQPDLRAGDERQFFRMDERRARNPAGDPFGGGANVIGGGQAGGVHGQFGAPACYR